MIKIIVSMGEKYAAYFAEIRSGAKFGVWDISKYGGGRLGGHLSHQRGVDFDLPFIGGRGNFDVQANSMAIAALMLSKPDFHHVPGQEMILVDYSLHDALGKGLRRLASEGVISEDQARRAVGALIHWPKHNDHFHIRIQLAKS